jgi:hypothetical protein
VTTDFNTVINIEKTEDTPQSAEKLKEYVQFLRGKSIMLKDKEERYIEQQRKILRYRRTIMHAIREFAIDFGQTREEAISVINRFEKILDEIDIDLAEEEDEIMG